MDFLVVWLAATTGLVAVVMFLMPELTPRSVRFGVRVPAAQQGNPILETSARRYRTGMLLSCIVSAGALGAAVGGWGDGWAVLALPVLLLGSLGTYVTVRIPILRAKASERWATSGPVVAAGALHPPEPEPAVWPWLVPAVAVWALFLVVGIILYPSLPATLPTHFRAAGSADTFSPKTIGTAFMGSITGAILLVVFSALGLGEGLVV